MLIFDEVTLAEVARKLRYTYGVEIVFEDRTLARRKFKGFVPTDNLDVLLKAFEELYNVKIERNDDQLIFSKMILNLITRNAMYHTQQTVCIL